MASYNHIVICGNLGQDPDLRYTASQQPVVTLNVATNENWKDKDGNDKEEVTWHRVVVWGKTAENCAKYLAKGRTVLVEGRMVNNNWEDDKGVKHYGMDLRAQRVQFIGGEKGARPAHPADVADAPSGGDRQAPRTGNGGGQQQQSNGETAFGGPETPGLDDIPF